MDAIIARRTLKLRFIYKRIEKTKKLELNFQICLVVEEINRPTISGL